MFIIKTMKEMTIAVKNCQKWKDFFYIDIMKDL